MKKVILLLPILTFAFSVFKISDLSSDNITTKIKNQIFFIKVKKKINLFKYKLKLYSYELNKYIDFNKTKITSNKNEDIYKVVVDKEYKRLRFEIKYGSKIDKSDDFSIKPDEIKVDLISPHNYVLTIPNSRYYGNFKYKSYEYKMKNGKGELNLTHKLSYFCLDNEWTLIDENDTTPSQRQMPCVNILSPIKIYR